VEDLPKDTPKRAIYKAAEVCELAHVQPYVLRSWESEFPKLGVVRAGTRLYRPADVEQVLRIKQLVFEEGLTLSGARRRIEEENGAVLDQAPAEEFVTPEMREQIGRVKDGLRQVLTLLGPDERTAEASSQLDGGGAQGQMRLHSAGNDREARPPANERGKRAKGASQKAIRSKAARDAHSTQRSRRRA
jgi:DNA-binding transcriptional MerR regulator